MTITKGGCMFTGIIRHLGKIEKIKKDENLYILTVKVKEDLISEIDVSNSVAVNGMCLTVTKLNKQSFQVEVVQETIRLTTISTWEEGTHVNLELAMRAIDRFDGHMVQGHIDGIARVKHMTELGDSWIIRFDCYSDFFKYLVKKGSVAIDGVSLTITDVLDDDFEVAIIPHTYKNTIFKNYVIGTEVNIETDILGKYTSKFINKS